MDYEIQVNNFQGPLDLLYKLVKKNKIEISDISLARVTKQYLQYVEHLKGNNIDLASEFMVIASELIEIKAKLLLPQNNSDNEQKEDESDLVQRLEEYKLFKNVSELLRDYENKAANSFALPGEIELTRQPARLKIDRTPEELFDIYRKALRSNEEVEEEKTTLSQLNSINPDRLNVEDKTEEITTRIKKTKGVNFRELINNARDPLEIVVTLLSILEMMRLKKVKVKQNNLFDKIIVEPEKLGKVGEVI